MENKKWYQLGDAANRNRLATTVIWFTFMAIIILALVYYLTNRDPETMNTIFNTLIPLFATWVGTVLAFYFGKENFDIASKRYNNLIDKLSPDVLDDIKVSQIMISKQTMVFKNLNEVEDKKVKEIIDFLSEIKKTRLPILEDEKIKYIIHKTTFLNALNELGDEASATTYSFKDFIANDVYKDKALSYLQFEENVILEEIRSALGRNSNIKDVFIIGTQKNVVGWITDTLLLRYLSGESVKIS
ncbi:hypothetical protein [Ascidiimonas aurantiaca]|uniref:hypothetical protein n=1 Tax=Ascidiimonas aurantiaca TaxID=1685432 RepID=UPI0030ED3346